MNRHIISHDKAIKFIFGGNSLFTVKNSLTENRFTFRVKKKSKSDIFFVSVLTSPGIFQFIGSIYEDSGFKHSKKSNIGIESNSVIVFDYIIEKLRSDKLKSYIEIWHEGKCGKCGRTLTVPTSIESGFGPECIKNVKI